MRTLAFAPRRPVFFLPLLLCVFIASVLSACSGSGLVRPEQTAVTDWVTLSEGQTFGQTFVAHYAGLSGVYFFISPNPGPVDGEIRLHLRSDPTISSDLAVSLNTLFIGAADATTFYGFFLPPQADSDGKYYYASLEYVGSGSLRVGISGGDAYQNGSLYQNGAPVDAQAAFQLSYSRRRAFMALALESLGWLGEAFLGLFLFILPGWGLFSLLWRGWSKYIWTVKLGLSAGLSLALYPLLALWTDLVHLHLGALYAWLPPLVGLGMILWRNRLLFKRRFTLSRLHLPSRASLVVALPDLTFFLLIALVCLTRFFAIRSLEGPLWADSVEHTVMTQLFVDHGGLFTSWLPYAPYQSLTVQFGFSLASAVYAWLTGAGSVQATLVTGQLVNILAILVLYPLAVKITNGNRWAGVGAVLAGGLFSHMPAHYVNWGRFAQLAGEVILPVALWLIWEAVSPTADSTADKRERRLWQLGLIGFSAVALAGLVLTYYRMAYFYAAFILVLLLCACLPAWRRDGWLWLQKLVVLLAVGGVGLTLIIPWAVQVSGSLLAGYVDAGLTFATPLETVLFDLRGWKDVFSFVPVSLAVLAGIAFLWSLIHRRWMVAGMMLWFVLVTAVIPGRLIHFPGANMMQSFAIMIALYIPLSLMTGWLVAEVVQVWKRPAWAGAVSIALVLAGLYFANAQRTIPDPNRYAYLTRPDKRAFAWVNQNIPSEAHFFVEGIIYNETSIIGSDAGWWLPLFTRRSNTMPPQYAINEAPIQPGYTESLIDLVDKLQDLPLDSTEAVARLCAEHVTHVYIGQQQGTAALRFLGYPQLFTPAALINSPSYHLIYHQDRVYIFELTAGACHE